MKINPNHPGTYAGQEARIIVAAEMSDGRLLYALKTAAGTVATDFETARRLRELAATSRLRLIDEPTP